MKKNHSIDIAINDTLAIVKDKSIYRDVNTVLQVMTHDQRMLHYGRRKLHNAHKMNKGYCVNLPTR